MKDTQIVIGTDRKSIADFISNLLQQPRRKERRYENMAFYIDHQWVNNLIELCNQRLQQNHFSLCSFEMQIGYEDGHVEIIQEKEAFSTYHNSAKQMSVSLDLRLSYLVEFANSSSPEKQDVRFYALAHNTKNSLDEEQPQPYLYYSVNYSNLTWGEDMSRHIDSHVEIALTRERAFLKALRLAGKIRASVALGITFPIFAIAFNLYVIAGNKFDISSAQQALIKSTSTDEKIGQILNLLIQSELDRRNFPVLKLLMFSVIAALIASIPEICRFVLKKMNLSFVAMNQSTIDTYNNCKDRNVRLKWIIIGASITIPIGAVVAYLKSV